MTAILITFFGCKKDVPPIVIDNSEQTVQDSISVFFENDTIKFRPVKCPNDYEFMTSLISVAIRQDSFGINRRTIILSEDTIACYVNELQIGFDITDKIENYPVTKEILRTHLNQIQSQTSTSSRFEVKFSDECYTYQNFERIFNDSIQLYTFSKNDLFSYEIEEYKIIDGNDCGYNSRHFLVELKGSFSGYLYTTPNVLNKDSVFIECPNFKIRVLHNLDN